MLLGESCFVSSRFVSFNCEKDANTSLLLHILSYAFQFLTFLQMRKDSKLLLVLGVWTDSIYYIDCQQLDFDGPELACIGILAIMG